MKPLPKFTLWILILTEFKILKEFNSENLARYGTTLLEVGASWICYISRLGWTACGLNELRGKIALVERGWSKRGRKSEGNYLSDFKKFWYIFF